MDTSTDATTQRLDKLERQNRHLRAGLVSIAMGIGALFLTAAAPTRTPSVTAQKFVLVDATGTPRATLGMFEGGVALTFWDAVTHRPLAGFGTQQDGAMLTLFDAKTAARRVSIASVPNGTGIEVSGKKGSFELGIQTNGTPAFEMLSGSAMHRTFAAKLSLRHDGEPYLHLDDASTGLVRLALGESSLTNRNRGGNIDTPASTITAFDTKGKVIRQWP